MSGTGVGGSVHQLGLAVEAIKVTPTFRHLDVHTDDYGHDIPPEVLWHLADARIDMTLVHYDDSLLDECVLESMGGFDDTAPGAVAGVYAGAGLPLGGGVQRWSAGNHYITVYLSSPVQQVPWRFRTCYLEQQPFVYPLGTERSMVQLRWRAIAYGFQSATTEQTGSDNGQPIFTTTISEITSAGKILWDYMDAADDTTAAN